MSRPILSGVFAMWNPNVTCDVQFRTRTDPGRFGRALLTADPGALPALQEESLEGGA
jgi:hypothetical protein